MSYEEFRKRIDTARQILVGAVPSPAGQIDQITYALMYKFMNDIDDQSRAIGGKPTYFVGDYAKYNWHELMKPGLEAHDQLELYRQAIQGMSKNPGLPPLFREIYQNAFLPFNSPNVLRLFLEEINKFNHGDTDDIGDAYEYLLSITGAQGDVGQFRTPRHIIKFIVEAINPSKDDTVLDPAVGTAGFLIAAYNHVKSQHDGKDAQGNANDERHLTADELEKLHHNYRGFDIDPTMVRTASVNMYLHGFTSPDIRNHDSLSSEDYWNDHYDIILANPPFMTPKGGIQPHKKFSITAKRAEVLFVDYIASHLKPNGRAGVIAPEGIIFQSGKAYKELRKNLVENYLYAVVSLPAGVFQPYSGVKTSVLLMDKQLAKERDNILFVKIENDGYSLGAQRRKIAGEQFTETLELVEKFKAGQEINSTLAHAVMRDQIAEAGDYNLSGDRYIANNAVHSLEYQLVNLGDVVDVIGGSTPLKSNESFWEGGTIPWFTVDDIRRSGRLITNTQKYITEKALHETSIKLVPERSVLLCCTASVGEFAFTHIALTTNQQFNALVVKDTAVLLPEYLYWAVSDFKDKLELMAGKTSFSFVSAGTLKTMKIPLPPIDIQREIVAELDGYQKIIDAAGTIVKTYKPTIKINPEWQIKKLGDILLTKPTYGSGASKTDFDGRNRYVRITDITDNGVLKNNDAVSPSEIEPKYFLAKNDLLIARSGSVGRTYFHNREDINYQWAGYLINFRIDESIALSSYVYYVTKTPLWWSWVSRLSKTGTLTNINAQEYSSFEIPLPPIEIQREIVAKLEAERQLVDANKKLIEIYQQKIKSKLAEIWGE